MSLASIFDERSPAPLWSALGEKLGRASWVFHPSWGLHALAPHDIRQWLACVVPASARPLAPDWARPAARLALLRPDDLRRVAGLFGLACHRGALRRCIDGPARRALHGMWSPRTVEALLDDPPLRERAVARDDWRVDPLCDEGAAHLAVAVKALGGLAWITRAGWPRRLPEVAPALPAGAADEFLAWCIARLRDEPWWSG